VSGPILPPAPVAPASFHPPTSLRRACEEFESLFLALLLRQMRATVPSGGALAPGAGRQLFDALWVQEIGRAAARSSPLGIADTLEAHLAGPAPKGPHATEPKPALKKPAPPTEYLTGMP